ncbi:hypothetical protein HH308_28390 [Gordonia sp. TBRC 11910]|uniref:DUF35 domain-containing protein n=1 Tax=Gordonia asplenii TaxID=2725283 RepID=A0A848L3Y6_9ACTN|nr:hypothetical protein [Gordonia asplenii]NMO05142.1 hypothetical protein [Gordonia asplenii]
MSVTDLAEGLFLDADGASALRGGRCVSCGHTAFPAPATCLDCGCDTMQIALGRRAELICATTVRMATANFDAGHVVGYVRVEAGVRVFAPLAHELADAPPGTLLTVDVGPLWTEGGDDIRAYRFIPAKAATDA